MPHGTNNTHCSHKTKVNSPHGHFLVNLGQSNPLHLFHASLYKHNSLFAFLTGRARLCDVFPVTQQTASNHQKAKRIPHFISFQQKKKQ